MVIGYRAGKIVSLRWDWIRGKRIHLSDSKTGPRILFNKTLPGFGLAVPAPVAGAPLGSDLDPDAVLRSHAAALAVRTRRTAAANHGRLR